MDKKERKIILRRIYRDVTTKDKKNTERVSRKMGGIATVNNSISRVRSQIYGTRLD